MNGQKFFFVRHAETEWNQRNLCQGQTDVPLSQKGFQEAKALALNLQNLPIKCIVSSPLSRALATAQEISHSNPGAKLHIISELSERYWGSLEGMPNDEMYAIEELEEANPDYFSGMGIEPRKHFRERVQRGIFLAQTHHPHPLIISHGRVFLEICSILGIPPIRQIPHCQLLTMHSNK